MYYNGGFKMGLNEEIADNWVIYVNWMRCGMREADDALNESNRRLIKAYQKEHPNAKGYKLWKGIIDIPEQVYNFGIDLIFDGTPEIINEINNESDEFKRLKIFEKYGAVGIVWS